MLLAVVGAAAAGGACDAGKRHEQPVVGPSITILGANVGNNQTIPADGVIQIAFDRYLLPSTIVRQSYLLLDANGQIALPNQAVQTIYDPVARTVTIAGPSGPGRPFLTPGQSYRLELGIPPDEGDVGGFRAIDRATLDPNQQRVLAFVATAETGQAQIEPPVSFCADILPMFVAKCSSPTCHGSDRAAASLVLNSSEAVRVTARGRVAQGANTSGRAGQGEPAGRIFGINMPLIAPDDPGNSWLLYKIELARFPTVDTGAPEPFACTPPAGAPPIPPPSAPYAPIVPARLQADELEREVLNDFVLGREMPYPLGSVGSPLDQALTFAERERVRIWIAQGAQITECGGCGALPTASDAGPSDAGASDAGPADASDQ